MTIKEKADAIDRAIEKDWGGELGEILWAESCQCVNEEELAELYDEYRTELQERGLA